MKWNGSVPDTRTHEQLREDWGTVMRQMVDLAVNHPAQYKATMQRLRKVSVTAYVNITDAVRMAMQEAA